MSRHKRHKNVQRFLNNYNLLKLSVENMEIELKEIEKESGLRAISYEQEAVSPTNKITSMAEDTAIRNIEHKDLVMKRKEIIESKLKRVDNALNKLCDLEREIIERKDIDIQPWYEIECDLPCSLRTGRRIRQKAFDKLAICLYGDEHLDYLPCV